jgi:L-alanine-DL-glutamate epimerase-like enolase superfamily enzyme
MDHYMLGHPYVKHGIDMACWDILGKKAGVPLYALFGGRLQERVPTAGWIPPEHGELMDKRIAAIRANTCRQFSAKASGDPDKDIAFIVKLGEKMLPGESLKVDANGGWRVDEAIRIMRATAQVDVYFEQPCWTYEECRTVFQACGRPIVLDECALDLRTIVRGWEEGVCSALNLKFGRVGGLTPTLEMRNLCVALGIPVHIQCSGGSNLIQAAIVHLAHATPENRLLWIWDIGDLVNFKTVENPFEQIDGYMQAGDGHGLGVTPIPDVLGDPDAIYE